MPNKRLERARQSLPEGYQFGDARDRSLHRLGDIYGVADVRMGGYQIVRDGAFDLRIEPIAGRNVIEGERHSDDWAV